MEKSQADYILPWSEFPHDLICPWCNKGPFKGANGLRGHAYHKHDHIKWEHDPSKDKWNNKKYIRKYDVRNLTDPNDLKPWQRLAIVQHTFMGDSYKSIADKFHKGKSGLRDVFSSEAAKKYQEEIIEKSEDMPALLVMAIQASTPYLAVQDALALQMAVEVSDYEFVHKFVQDQYKIAGVETEVKHDAGLQQQAIVINLNSDSLETPRVKSSHQILEADVVQED